MLEVQLRAGGRIVGDTHSSITKVDSLQGSLSTFIKPLGFHQIGCGVSDIAIDDLSNIGVVDRGKDGGTKQVGLADDRSAIL